MMGNDDGEGDFKGDGEGDWWWWWKFIIVRYDDVIDEMEIKHFWNFNSHCGFNEKIRMGTQLQQSLFTKKI